MGPSAEKKWQGIPVVEKSKKENQCSGSIDPITDRRHYADPDLAPLARSRGGSINAIPKWLHMGGR